MASHSSAGRSANHPRDMSYDLIKPLAAKAEWIQINYIELH